MKRKPYPLIIIIISATFFSNCIPQKKLDYLQDPFLNQANYKLQQEPEILIKPSDELYINVSSFDDASFNYFENAEEASRMGFNNELSVYLVSYTVDSSGDIYFPILGNVRVAGLTLEQVRQLLKEQLSEYLNQPIVIIKYAYKKVTVLGEVQAPGNYLYTKDKLTIFEAIGMSGDLTIHGNRKEIYLLREEADSIIKNKVDLTKDEIIFSQFYYIQPDDVIYVKSRKSSKWLITSTPISTLLASISTIILIINVVQNN